MWEETAIALRANGRILSYMGMANMHGWMDRSIVASTHLTKKKVLESSNGLMEGNMKVSGLVESRMDLATIAGRMVQSVIQFGKQGNQHLRRRSIGSLTDRPKIAC